MDKDYAERLIKSPSENLSLELKAWLDLEDAEHKAKLVRALLALRNFNGGYIIIGLDDKTGKPSPNPPAEPKACYHVDDLQKLVGTYASDPFGIEVEYPERDGCQYPVIQIPSGVQVPVAVKKEIQNSGNKPILRIGEVMFRTLGKSNVVSSAAPAPEDWRQIMEICFANREADLAGFVRRHLLSGELPTVLADLGAFAKRPAAPSLEETCRSFANKCAKRASDSETRRKMLALPEAFGSLEIAAVLDPPAEGFTADNPFYSRLMSSKPQYDHGLWLDTRVFQDVADHPIPDVDGWDSLIDFGGDWKLREYARLERTGRFYVSRPLTEDSTAQQRGAKPGTVLGIESTLSCVAEGLAVVTAFAQSLAGDRAAEGHIGFFVRLKGIEGRRLISATGVAAQLIAYENRSAEDQYGEFVEVPIATSPANLGPYAVPILRPLFAIFNGYSMPAASIERRVAAYINRQPTAW